MKALLKALLTTLLWVSLAPAICKAGPDDAADAVVTKLQSTLLDVMQHATALGYTGRYDQLAPVLTSSFDVPYISRLVLGKYWSTLDHEQKSEFIKTFVNYGIAAAASQFDGYNGETFRPVSKEQLESGRVVIRTELVKTDGEVISLDYLLSEKDGRWYILNVIANGVSDLSLKRAEYTAVIRDQGFDGLLAQLKQKTEEYKEPAAK
ncbi:MAG: ABC transporter substrate-binding protein [Gammaproteobacteria bacterium]|nr:ABC transporter substrate-binding protein [Gammaproteobacteria bacterium]